MCVGGYLTGPKSDTATWRIVGTQEQLNHEEEAGRDMISVSC